MNTTTTNTNRFDPSDRANWHRAGQASTFDPATQTVAPEPRRFPVTLSATEWKVVRRALLTHSKNVANFALGGTDEVWIADDVASFIANEAIAAGLDHNDI